MMWFISVWLTLKHVAKIIYKVWKRVNIHTRVAFTPIKPHVWPQSLWTHLKKHTQIHPVLPDHVTPVKTSPVTVWYPRMCVSGESDPLNQWQRCERSKCVWNYLNIKRSGTGGMSASAGSRSERSIAVDETVGLPFLKSFRFHASELVLILSSWIKYYILK